MNTFNPDNAISLEIKRDIRDMSKHYMVNKHKGSVVRAMYKISLKDAAEEYAKARDIQPHTNLNLLHAIVNAQHLTYLCSCGEHHEYGVTADELIIEGLEKTLDFHIERGVEEMEHHLSFYISMILNERVIKYLGFLIEALKANTE